MKLRSKLPSILAAAGALLSPSGNSSPSAQFTTPYNTSGVMIPRTIFSNYYRNRSKYCPRECARARLGWRRPVRAVELPPGTVARRGV